MLTHLAWKRQGFEQKAMYRKGLGWIGVNAGVPGNSNNAYAGGYGVAHILAKHGAEGVTPSVIAETLQFGEMYRNYEPKFNKINASKVSIIRGNNIAVVSKFRDGRILITDFDVIKGHDGRDVSAKIEEQKKGGRYFVRGENK